uniref:(northern house mosquito) hypothetical protein n=1 Tax=Culex pipiens TaxID=7175 RepID=A0A8D8DEP0_CULPI
MKLTLSKEIIFLFRAAINNCSKLWTRDFNRRHFCCKTFDLALYLVFCAIRAFFKIGTATNASFADKLCSTFPMIMIVLVVLNPPENRLKTRAVLTDKQT